MRVSLEIDGLDESLDALGQFKDGFTAELETDLEMATFPIDYALAEYPPERPESKYERTYNYLNLLDSKISVFGSEVDYTATQGADYSLYLRGDGDAYEGAWMHRGIWRSLRNILDTFLPVVNFRLQDRIDAFIRRVWGT